MAVRRPADWPPGVEGPLAELEKIRSELDTLFHRFEPVYARSLSDSLSAMEVSEEVDAFLVRMDLAGIEEHEIEVSAGGRALTVSIRHEIQRTEVDATQSTQSAERTMAQSTVRFPVDIDPDGMEAKCMEGKLHIRLPKVRASAPRKITVKREG